MTTFVPRTPYTEAELAELYPKQLELQLVQVVSISSSLEQKNDWLSDHHAIFSD